LSTDNGSFLPPGVCPSFIQYKLEEVSFAIARHPRRNLLMEIPIPIEYRRVWGVGAAVNMVNRLVTACVAVGFVVTEALHRLGREVHHLL
jgi:hypothetical protein